MYIMPIFTSAGFELSTLCARIYIENCDKIVKCVCIKGNLKQIFSSTIIFLALRKNDTLTAMIKIN